MFKRGIITCVLFLSAHHLQAQQYGLFNTKTLFDGFENPAQKVFTLDSSRKFASNFLLPYFGLGAANKGGADVIRRAINEGVYSARDLPLGTGKLNTAEQHSNIYLLTLKIFQSYKYQKELGFSWQLRTDGNASYTNETMAILDNYRRFDDGKEYDDVFNNKGYAQTYHQFSVTYRENYNKRLSFGVKFSLLSGTTYNNLKITDSYFRLNQEANDVEARLAGNYRASFLYGKEISSNTFMPTFRNPGASVSFGTSYNSKSGVFIMANLKDLGFIRWGKSAFISDFKGNIEVDDLQGTSNSQLQTKLTDIATQQAKNSSFYSVTNAKADFMVSKTFDFYTPGLIISKNLFYKGGDIVMVNKFRYENVSLTAVPTYNLNEFFMLGMQGMYQTPNFEFFLGSDDLLKTVSQVNGAIKRDATVGKGYNGASVYIGLGIKFGNTVEHPQNSSTMPGLVEEPPSIFRRFLNIFSKKK